MRLTVKRIFAEKQSFQTGNPINLVLGNASHGETYFLANILIRRTLNGK